MEELHQQYAEDFCFFLPCVLVSAIALSYCTEETSTSRGSFQEFNMIFYKFNLSCIVFWCTEAYSLERWLLVSLAIGLFNYSSVLNQRDKSQFISGVVGLTVTRRSHGKAWNGCGGFMLTTTCSVWVSLEVAVENDDDEGRTEPGLGCRGGTPQFS